MGNRSAVMLQPEEVAEIQKDTGCMYNQFDDNKLSNVESVTVLIRDAAGIM